MLSSASKFLLKIAAGVGFFLCSIEPFAQCLSYSYDSAGNLKTIGTGDLQTDPFNCGSCGNKCAPGRQCRAGQCTGGTTPVGVVPPFEGVECFVFDDGYTNIEGPSDAIFISGRTSPNEQGQACIPGGQFGHCHRWFGLCKTVKTNQNLVFFVFDDGYENTAGPSDAIYIPKDGNKACVADATSTGTCRRWFGLAVTEDGRASTCSVFDDGYTFKSKRSDAIFIPTPIPAPGSACVATASDGLCRRWFGLCDVQDPPAWLVVPPNQLLTK